MSTDLLFADGDLIMRERWLEGGACRYNFFFNPSNKPGVDMPDCPHPYSFKYPKYTPM
jgi:hypothetical protein